MQEKSQIDWVNGNNQSSKADFISSVFTRNHDFEGWSYKYQKQHSGVIVGFLGRYNPLKVNLGPELNWHESNTDNWDRKVVLIDPDEHADGQKILIEGTASDKSAGFVSKLQREINSNDYEGRYMYINAILEEQSLGEIFDRYKNQVVEISLDFPIANMPSGINSPLSSARRKFAEADASLTTVVKAENSNINVETDVISESTKHAADVGAAIKVKVSEDGTKKKTVVYDSSKQDRIKQISLSLADKIISTDEKISEIVSKLFGSR